jgi:hypothetical protein
MPAPPPGILHLGSREEVYTSGVYSYQHLLLRAWDALGLSGVLVIRGIPTVYLREDEKALSPQEVSDLHKKFWNQGVATLLVLIDPGKTRVLSGMVPPQRVNAEASPGAEKLNSFVAELGIAGKAIRAHRRKGHGEAREAWQTFCRQVASGHFYRLHAPQKKEPAKFDSSQMVDGYLLKQLAAVRDQLTRGEHKLPVEKAHAFLGRLLFTCYLVDRGIVRLDDPKYFPKQNWSTLQDLLAGQDEEVMRQLYGRLFPQLKRDFNGSMFDEEGLADEQAAIRPEHLRAVRHFFGAHDVITGQQTLGFWPYDFRFLPVETISAIYENFLAKENDETKREEGAFYTPRFLAEMTLDLAMEGRGGCTGKRYLDASCGSAIFLVLVFNRLAAEWAAKHPRKAESASEAAYRAKDAALRGALASLRGVDINLTACRIACFSLYLAFLDQFEPSDIRTYLQHSETNKLPNLLQFADKKRKRPDIPVVWEGDFFPLAETWEKNPSERFDYIVGNPPWVGRSAKITQRFMEGTPAVLAPGGKAGLVLPTKVFFNKTDAFQRKWLCDVTLEKVVQLADYSFLLFTNALCPCMIVRFNSQKPVIETHSVEYLTPKVGRADLRQGAIPITAADRKEIRLRLLLGACDQDAATMAWKSHFWGTPRDLKFLNHLFALPRLGEIAGTPAEVRKGSKRWTKGQGFQPLRPGQKPGGEPKPIVTTDDPGESWSPDDLYIDASELAGLAAYPQQLCGTLGKFLVEEKCFQDKLRRKPKNAVFSPPLVLLNQGFTGATFFDYSVRFQHSLESIAGPASDADSLLLLAAYLRSDLARYFAFHTAANIGTERDKVHLEELFTFPFLLPGEKSAVTPAVAKIATRLRKLKNDMEADVQRLEQQFDPSAFQLQNSDHTTPEEARRKWLERWAARTAKVQEEIEPLIYEHFGLTDQERALIGDTVGIFDKSDTPGTWETAMPTLEPIVDTGLEKYGDMLATTLRSWSIKDSLAVKLIGGINENLGLAVLRVEQTKGKGGFKTAPLSEELAAAVKRIEEEAATTNGTLVYLRDETWWFDGPAITIAKPALRGRWTRTAALNDAVEIYATIQQSRHAGK